jgi:hypothetical protein
MNGVRLALTANLLENRCMYLRASKKQLEYIDSLCRQLDMINPTLYTKYKLEDAAKLITRLKRKLDKQRAQTRQTNLF